MSRLKKLEALLAKGQLSRREFIAYASAVGLTAAISPALRPNNVQSGPFHGCMKCPDICLYQYEAAFLVSLPRVRRSFDQAINEPVSDWQVWIGLARQALAVAEEIVGQKSPYQQGLAWCLLVQDVHRRKLSMGAEDRTISNLYFIMGGER